SPARGEGVIAQYCDDRGRSVFVRLVLAVVARQLPNRGPAAQLHAVLLVDEDDLHVHHVAHLADVVDAVDVFVRQLADVAQAIFAGQNLDEGAKVFYAGHPSVVDLADLHRLGERFDATHGRLGAFRFVAGDRHRAIVLDFDRRAGLFLDGANRLAARTDE